MFTSSTSLRAGLLAWSRGLLFGGLIVAGSAPVRAQLPATASPTVPLRHNLSLEAQSVASGGKSQTSAQGTSLPNGEIVSDARVAKSQQNVQFTVRNYDTAPDTVTVNWYFVAAPVSLNGTAQAKEYILNQGSQTLTIEGTKSETQTVSSKEVEVVSKRSTGTTVEGNNTYLLLSNTQQGAMVRGWMVRLTADGKVVATRGSSQKYEDIAKDDLKLNALSAPRHGPVGKR